MMKLIDKLNETLTYLQARGVGKVDLGLILGSGLGELADEINSTVRIDYANIPHFQKTTVTGHAGCLIYGELSGKQVLLMQGRFHFYEGYSMAEITYPVRLMTKLGARGLIVTNAAGGVNAAFKPSDLMLISDHINYNGQNPLIGENAEAFGTRFPDMSAAYDKEYRQIAKKAASQLDIDLVEGIYMFFSGPSYETPAEIRFARTIGADAVGMSSVPEVIVARHSGLRVLGISAISNYASGMQGTLDHSEIISITEKIKPKFKELIKQILEELD
ncbi:MAG: purine-nucleoside phosphorylase [Streptococcaceae bacterium]|jgi:purine-nucleoside phosphorylase|nr:purine-nucleoside phosphorylase [Streptococcaceae bacterium]